MATDANGGRGIKLGEKSIKQDPLVLFFSKKLAIKMQYKPNIGPPCYINYNFGKNTKNSVPRVFNLYGYC